MSTPMGEQFGDLVLELRAMSANMVANGPRSDSLPELLAAAAREIEGMRSIIVKTNEIVSEGAMEGFNPLAGTWADRLFANQHYLHKARAYRAEGLPRSKARGSISRPSQGTSSGGEK